VLEPLVLAALAAAAPQERVRAYTAHEQDIWRDLETEVEARLPGIDLVWSEASSSEIFKRMRAERDSPQAALVFGGDEIEYRRAAAAGMFAPYRSPAAAGLDRAYVEESSLFVLPFVLPIGLVYNARLLTAAEAPRDWDDLVTHSRFAGRVLLRDPAPSGTMKTAFGAIIQGKLARGLTEDDVFEWFRELDAVTREYKASPYDLLDALHRGEGLVTIWNIPEIVRRQQPGPGRQDLGYVVPASGTPLTGEGLALTANGPARAAAQRVYDALLAPDLVLRVVQRYGKCPAPRTDLDPAQLPAHARDALRHPMQLDLELQNANIDRWMQRWGDEVKGAGSRLAWVDSALSLVFALVVLVFALTAARRVFQREGARSG
jgi:iron(III) transport system substrate-binding protein